MKFLKKFENSCFNFIHAINLMIFFNLNGAFNALLSHILGDSKLTDKIKNAYF